MEYLLSESCCASPPPTFHHLSEGYQERFCTPFQGRGVPSFLSKTHSFIRQMWSKWLKATNISEPGPLHLQAGDTAPAV